MIRQPPKIDFTQYEPGYARLFALLRRVGWNERRFVDFVDADLGPDGEPRGILILHDYAEAFLHSFYGLEVAVKEGNVPAGFSLKLGEQWDSMSFDKHGWCINGLSDFTFPYPFLSTNGAVGFVTEKGQAFTIDDCYQRTIHANDPFQLMDYLLFRENTPGLERSYVEWDLIPRDYKHLVWNRPLEYHLARYRAYAQTEGNRTEYVLEQIKYPQLFKITASDLTESGQDLFVSYRRSDREMGASTARGLVVRKLLDEFFEKRYRNQITRIHLKDLSTEETTVIGWPS